MIKGHQNQPVEERLKTLGIFFLEKIQGGPHCSVPVLTGQLQRGRRFSLCKEPHEEDKGTGCIWRTFILTQEKIYYSKNILFRDIAESSSLEVFKMQFDRRLGNITWHGCPMQG